MRSPPRIAVGMPVLKGDEDDCRPGQPIMWFKDFSYSTRWNEYQLWRRWSVWDKQNPPLPAEQRHIDTSRTAAIQHP